MHSKLTVAQVVTSLSKKRNPWLLSSLAEQQGEDESSMGESKEEPWVNF